MNDKANPVISTKELIVFAFLGTIMFCSKLIMEALPNIHLVGMLTMTYTLVYRRKALIPIYLFALLMGVYEGFTLWWLPYLYIWTILWGVTMLLPRRMSRRLRMIVYPMVCCLHGLLYGTLFSPFQALMMGLNFKATVAWIAAGIPFDVIHGVGNFILGFLILPLSELLLRLDRGIYTSHGE